MASTATRRIGPERGLRIRAHRQAAGLSLTQASRLIALALDRPWNRPRDRAKLAYIESGHTAISEERTALILAAFRAGHAAAQAAGSPNGGEGPETAGTSRPVAPAAGQDGAR